jgi:hypothetical protein
MSIGITSTISQSPTPVYNTLMSKVPPHHNLQHMALAWLVNKTDNTKLREKNMYTILIHGSPNNHLSGSKRGAWRSPSSALVAAVPETSGGVWCRRKRSIPMRAAMTPRRGRAWARSTRAYTLCLNAFAPARCGAMRSSSYRHCK